jgi:ribosome biogenesis protein BRX1
MAAIYKALSKPDSKKEKSNGVAKEHRQRVLMLTSRGVTFRYVL